MIKVGMPIMLIATIAKLYIIYDTRVYVNVLLDELVNNTVKQMNNL